MKVAVTGALGFVGPHLVAHLEECGDDVLPLDRHGPDPFDVTDADDVHQRLRDARPAVVYHLAALSHVGESWKSPAASFRVNAEGTLNVLHACAVLNVAARHRRAELRGVRPGHRSRAAAHRRVADPPGDAIRRGEGRGGRARAAGVPRRGPRRDPRPAVQPHRSGPVPAVRRSRARGKDRARRGGGDRRDPGRIARRDSRHHRRPRRRARVPAARGAGRTRRGLQRVLRDRRQRAGDRGPAAGPGRGDRSGSSPTPRSCAPSTSRASSAATPSCARPPAGTRRSRSTGRCPTCSTPPAPPSEPPVS